MFVPVGDHPNPRGFPLVNWLLIAANVAVYVLFTLPLSTDAALARFEPGQMLEYVSFLVPQLLENPELDLRSRMLLQEFLHSPAQVQLALAPSMLQQLGVSGYDLFVFEHGYRPVAASWSDLLVSMFLHAGLAHLLGNMLFLWIYGDNVEHRLGKLGYLLAYLATGAAATVTHAFLSPEPELPVVGASGAISGVLGFYFLWFPRNVVKVFVVLFPFFVDVVLLPARWVLGFYLVVDNLLPFLLQSSSSGVAHGAHIGGFVVGLCLAVLLRRYREVQGVRSFRGPPGANGPVADLLEAAGSGDWHGAAVRLLELPRAEAHRVPADTWLAIARWLAGNAAPEVAATAYRRFLATHPRGPGLDEANLGLGLLHLEHGEATTAYQYLLSALDGTPSPSVAARARAGIARIEELQRRRRKLW